MLGVPTSFNQATQRSTSRNVSAPLYIMESIDGIIAELLMSEDVCLNLFYETLKIP